jgi:hypothetical protein
LLGLFRHGEYSVRFRVSSEYVLESRDETIAYNLVGLLGLFGPLLSGLDLLAELVDFLWVAWQRSGNKVMSASDVDDCCLTNCPEKTTDLLDSVL